MSVVYVACTNVGRAMLNAHLAYHKNIKIGGVFNLTQSKGNLKSNYDNFADIAESHDLPIHFVTSINNSDIIDTIRKLRPKIIIQAGWSQKFTNELLKIPKFGCIGEHPSPLPRGKGAAAINWAIINGERRWADSFFVMNENYDDGPILSQRQFEIEKDETVKSVYEKVAWHAHLAIKQNLPNWHIGEFSFVNNSKNVPSYHGRRKPEDGELLSSMTAQTMMNYVRALTSPFPGAFIDIKGTKIIILEGKIVKNTRKMSLKKIRSNIFTENYKVYLKGSCGNYLMPTLIQTDVCPPTSVTAYFQEMPEILL